LGGAYIGPYITDFGNNQDQVDQVHYMVKKAWKALQFTMRILKKEKSNTNSLTYTSLVRLILEYEVVCRDP
jgi:hypothetical protein